MPDWVYRVTVGEPDVDVHPPDMTWEKDSVVGVPGYSRYVSSSDGLVETAFSPSVLFVWRKIAD